MSTIQIIEASGKYLENWDKFIDESINGTIFHKRKFLSYHGDKFKNKERFLVILDGNALFAQIALIIEENSDGVRVAKSPYGASYGGIVFQKQPSYHKSKEVVVSLVQYLIDNKVNSITITFPISCCASNSMDTFYFSLLEQGFVSINRDISSTVELKDISESICNCVSSKARNMARKAEKNELIVMHKADIDDFWKVMQKTFLKFGKNPTHTLNEFKTLAFLLPEDIYVDLAYYHDIPVAGIGYFVINKLVNSSFYFCQDNEYQNLQGLSLLVLKALERSQQEGFSFFDFGTSTSNMIARDNIFSFKENYTKSGYFRETFEWKIQL